MRAEGHDLELVRIASGGLGGLAQHGHGLAETGAADRDPALAVLDDVREELGSGAAAEQDRQRLLHRLRPRPARREVHVLAVVARLLLLPERAHRQDDLAGVLAAGRVVDAVVGHFVDVPAESGAEHEPAAGQLIERGERLRRDDRLALRGERDAGAEAQPGGDGRCGAQG